MIAFDQDLNMHAFNFVDKFIEIEFNKADKSGLECFIQRAEEPGFSRIIGIKIGVSQTA
jgi:hypothetical protein